jgi:hypothetical protein
MLECARNTATLKPLYYSYYINAKRSRHEFKTLENTSFTPLLQLYLLPDIRAHCNAFSACFHNATNTISNSLGLFNDPLNSK